MTTAQTIAAMSREQIRLELREVRDLLLSMDEDDELLVEEMVELVTALEAHDAQTVAP